MANTSCFQKRPIGASARTIHSKKQRSVCVRSNFSNIGTRRNDAMAYSFHEHTADVRMDVEGDSYGALLEQSLLGMFEYLRPAGKGKRVERAIEVESPDRAALVVDFLNEALSLAHAHKEEYDSATFKVLSDRHVRATLVGNRVGSFGG